MISRRTLLLSPIAAALPDIPTEPAIMRTLRATRHGETFFVNVDVGTPYIVVLNPDWVARVTSVSDNKP